MSDDFDVYLLGKTATGDEIVELLNVESTLIIENRLYFEYDAFVAKQDGTYTGIRLVNDYGSGESSLAQSVNLREGDTLMINDSWAYLDRLV